MKGLNEKEFLDLVTKHQNIIHKVCNMFASDEQDRHDLFQEITIKLWMGYRTYKGQAAISTWMYRVALNTAITLQRKEKRKAETQALHSNIQPADENAEGYSKTDIEMLYLAINKLDSVDKAIILLYLEEKKYDEIAEIIGISRTHVGVKITRIKRKLEGILNETMEKV
ncbi:MAG: sigma-70 family RNA polymerase sigma factor [Bacteroidetes bacterium]|jgi:RNA polymerase sigma factor (sigma-70 family)|nr:sigma-70 family RNA polymerase sigma factor [Bacteroidota bacterium]MBT4402196.1 sigma-70 family RNA polymerase sigma factor [Bacteroidota bacterium]MBT4410746.1 sigma-70 family RNA polymerase sigma factor [Bacteroidota bacterium]MBT5427800.1 sigma-70 family RNA polymerase sigma factor [Bacteroidota bacterium]MBT7094915.1 sigma-70 family RNA polymerase sigma factor [Bacteroidota bacterium]